MTDTPQVAAGWYADPMAPGALRYWDGARWTEHTAPGPQAAPVATATPAPATARRRMSTGAIIGIVVGVIALIVVLLVVIAVPIFLSQQAKAEEAQAKAAVAEIAVAISSGAVETLGEPYVWTEGSTVRVDGAAAPYDSVELPPGVRYGGVVFSGYTFCTWVVMDDGTAFQWDDTVTEGACG